jgi:hypothetical protein
VFTPSTVNLVGLVSDSEIKTDSSGKTERASKVRDQKGELTIDILTGTKLLTGSGTPIPTIWAPELSDAGRAAPERCTDGESAGAERREIRPADHGDPVL